MGSYESNNAYVIEDDIKTEEDKLSVNSFGLSPLMGIEFGISDRISLRTESVLRLTYNEHTSEHIYHATGYTNKQKLSYWSTQLSAPFSLYLCLKF